MRVALVTVGDEILAGDTVNTNGAWLGEQLTGQGATVERRTVVPDRVADIARVVNEYRAEYDAVIVTGGLGPTHDDVTMEAVAAAFGADLAPDEAVRERLRERGYTDDDLAPGTVQIPARAESLANPEGVAPGCVVGTVYVLPGPPAEMEAMFEQVRDHFGGETTHVETVETPEPEKQLLDRIAGVRETFDVTLGSYPGETVTLKIQGGDQAEVAAAADWLRERVDPVETLRDRNQ
jgi:molybdenum cofactor synthesis domain-containing protein